MSSLPKPPKSHKPKSLGTDSDIATPEHEHLVATLWNNLDAIVQKHFAMGEKYILRQLQKIIDDERKTVRGQIGYLDQAITAGQYTIPPMWGTMKHEPEKKVVTLSKDQLKLLRGAKAHLENYAATLELSFDADSQEPKVLERTFQQSIYDHKGGVIGFVDIEAHISQPSALAPDWTAAWPSQSAADYALSGKSDLLEGLQHGERVPPDIRCIHDPIRAWFDVRTELPTTSVLVREFKTLREIALETEGKPFCFLVAKDIPEQVCDIMSHEGFGCISLREWDCT